MQFSYAVVVVVDDDDDAAAFRGVANRFEFISSFLAYFLLRFFYQTSKKSCSMLTKYTHTCHIINKPRTIYKPWLIS